VHQPNTERVYPVIDAGIDYLTAFAEKGFRSLEFERTADALAEYEISAGQRLRPALIEGFAGSKGEHWFHGRRDDGNMLVLSGPLSARGATDVIPFATNVSRIDVQVTIQTPPAQESFVVDGWKMLESKSAARGRPGSYEIRVRRPRGETLYVNSRRSDRYGRVYDWGAAHKMAVPKSIWRFELELKRRMALNCAMACRQLPSVGTHCSRLVEGFFNSKGVDTPWRIGDGDLASLPLAESKTRKTLTWFESCLSITIRKQINLWGADIVLPSLGLSEFLPNERNNNNARPCSRYCPLATECGTDDAQSVDTEYVPLC